MIWQSWGHSGGMTDPASGELDLSDPDLESSYTGSRIAAWFDKYLLDKETDTGPAFAYYRDWAPAGQAYATADAPPPPPAPCTSPATAPSSAYRSRWCAAAASTATGSSPPATRNPPSPG